MESENKSVWLDAHHDKLADVKTLSYLLTTADLES